MTLEQSPRVVATPLDTLLLLGPTPEGERLVSLPIEASLPRLSPPLRLVLAGQSLLAKTEQYPRI